MIILAERPPEHGSSTVQSPGRRASKARSIRPTHIAHWIALGAGSGLSPWAPGTVGTLWAWAVFWAIGDLLSRSDWLMVIGVAFVIGVWACGRTGRDFGVSDHSAMVWDEVVAFWLVLVLLPTDGWSQAVGFALFRFFDILKPPPIRQFDARLKGGFGVMFDDLLAAGFAIACWMVWEAL